MVFGELGLFLTLGSPATAPQAARLQHAALHKAPTETESKSLPWLSHRLRGEPTSLGYIIQHLATQSLSVAPEILSCRKLSWFPNAFLTFSIPPPKKRRLQQPEDLPDPEVRTPSRAEASAEIGAVRIRCSLPAQNGWGRMEGDLPMRGWRGHGRALGAHWTQCPWRPPGHTHVGCELVPSSRGKMMTLK